MEIPSGLTMNSLIWLTSPRPDDEGWTARIIEDVETICRANGVPFQVYTVPSRALLEDAFDKIADAARQGCRPFLQIDMHGSIELGLEIAGSKEFMSWPAFAGKLRGINVATAVRSGGDLHRRRGPSPRRRSRQRHTRGAATPSPATTRA